MIPKQVNIQAPLALNTHIAQCECGYDYEIIVGLDIAGGLRRPIYSVACMTCKDVYKVAYGAEEAVENFRYDRRNE